MNIPIQKISSSAKLPDYAHEQDAGMDLYANESLTVEPGTRTLISTGIALAIPPGYVGLVWDKSGIAVNSGLTTLAGVIDSGYRGEIKVAVYNTSEETYEIMNGHKIAQLLIQPVLQPTLTEVDQLDASHRQTNGFGSSGLTKTA